MMLTLPNKDNCDVKRVFRALSASSSKESLHSPPWTPSREKSSHPLSKSVGAADLPKIFSLPWKPQPKGSYAPEQEASTSYAYVADLSAELPVLSKEVYVLAEGDLLGNGVINIYEDNENKLVGSDLLVDVKMYYDDPMALKMTEISCAHSPKDENGVRIHTSPATKPTSINRHITINIRIPRSTGSEPLSLPAFRTHLPNFTHTVGDLGGIARFASVTLSSADKALIVKSLAARRIRLRTTNGSIEGAFVADEYVSLRTVNAPVNADVVLSSNGQSPGVLEVISSNAEITANVALDSTAPEGKTPVFRVLTKSANKPVDLKVISMPSRADTNIDVQTTNALATVRLPLTYEGKFDLHSTPYKPVVNVSEDVKDPSGLVRRREVKNDRERRGLLTGSVAWVWHEGAAAPEPLMKGNVSVKTSNAEAQLFL